MQLYQEIANNLATAADVLLARLLAEPHNISTIAHMIDPAMFAGQHPAFLVILQQFYQNGRFDPYTIGAKINDVPGMLAKSGEHPETSLEFAFDVYQHAHSQLCALDLKSVAEKGVINGMDAGEICAKMEGELKTKGAIRKSRAPDGYDDFQKQFDAKLKGVVLDYPVKPFLSTFRQFIPYWEPGSYIVTAGRPGMGKSYWALNECLHTAKNGNPATYINLENNPAMVYWRLFGMLCGFDYREPPDRWTPGRWTPEQMAAAGAAREQIAKIKEAKLFESLNTGRRLDHIISSLRADKMQRDTQFFAVDYLQLISNGDRNTSSVTEISAELRAFPLQTNTILMAVAQLSRYVEKRPMKRPEMSDLRESGGIEQDATDILLLWRPAYYGITDDEDGGIFPDEYCECIVAKSRNFGPSLIKCRFNPILGFYDTPPAPMPDFDTPFKPSDPKIIHNQPITTRPNLDTYIPF